jgi:hypothetical protein
MVFSGTSPDGRLVEIAELKDHPFFIASQFHPEFKSRPVRPHPLFAGFVAACRSNGPKRPPRRDRRRSAKPPRPGRRLRADKGRELSDGCV